MRVAPVAEEADPEELERYIYKFLKQSMKELYIGFPYQLEAFPTIIEDEDYVYQIYGDVYTSNYRVHKER